MPTVLVTGPAITQNSSCHFFHSGSRNHRWYSFCLPTDGWPDSRYLLDGRRHTINNPTTCPHQSRHTCQLSIILDSCPTAVTIKDYNQSSHHPQHTCPPAIMQQLSWWLMLILAAKPQTLTHAAHVSNFFCWTQTALSAFCWHDIFSQEMTHAVSAMLRLLDACQVLLPDSNHDAEVLCYR